MCILKCQLTIVKSRWRVHGCSLYHFFNFLYEIFPKKWREKKRLGGKEMESINIDNFSEGLVVRKTEKWGIGRESESCGQVFIF